MDLHELSILFLTVALDSITHLYKKTPVTKGSQAVLLLSKGLAEPPQELVPTDGRRDDQKNRNGNLKQDSVPHGGLHGFLAEHDNVQNEKSQASKERKNTHDDAEGEKTGILRYTRKSRGAD